MVTEQRFDLMIYGKVQGVGFRYSVMLKAESLGIKGYVQNQRDGSVFVAVQGATTAVDNFVNWCYQGPPAADVSRVEKTSRSIEKFLEFSVLY
jgi:acylphosphatase